MSGNQSMSNQAIRRLEKDLWESSDSLRANSKLTSQQYCMPVLGLIFLRYAYSRFKKIEAEIMKDRPVRKGKVKPVDESDFKSKNALFLPEQSRYSYLVNLPANISDLKLKKADSDEQLNSLGEVINYAMELIEAQSEQLKGILPREYTIFSDELLSDLLRIFNNDALDDVGGDIIGRIYEYFLSKFAPAVASDDGVFFTPKSLVKMIVNVIEPKSGTLLDCACGSGGMFVQSGDFITNTGSDDKAITFYGQEKVDYNAKLCLMNMAVHGLNGKIASGDEANTFYHDAHNLAGKCDYIMANPPFNVDKVKSEAAQNAGRLPFGLPGENDNKEFSNANYLWISYFYAYLNDHGRAGFVMASSATDSQYKDKNIREQIIKTGHVDVMISVGNNFFYTKTLPCSLWFFDKGKKKELLDKILFIDARNYYTVVDRTLNEWNEWQLKNLDSIVWLYRGETAKYQDLLREYHNVLGDGSFKDIQKHCEQNIANLQAELKTKLEDLDKDSSLKRNIKSTKKKKLQAEYDVKIFEAEEMHTVAKEAVWLYEKFGDGEYKDILGLCKIADISEVESKGWSLTPGAYVGVAPVENDGVKFQERMKEIHQELIKLQAESNDLMNTITQNFRELGL